MTRLVIDFPDRGYEQHPTPRSCQQQFHSALQQFFSTKGLAYCLSLAMFISLFRFRHYTAPKLDPEDPLKPLPFFDIN